MARTISAGVRLALAAYGRRLHERFGSRLRTLRLFGSYARGEADEESDVDVLVLIDALTPEEVRLAAGEAAAVSRQSGLALAPLPMAVEQYAEQRAERRSLAVEIDQQGISL